MSQPDSSIQESMREEVVQQRSQSEHYTTLNTSSHNTLNPWVKQTRFERLCEAVSTLVLCGHIHRFYREVIY